MGSGQMREWDMCVLESLAVTATYRCLYDEQIPLRKKRRYVIVVAHDAQPSEQRAQEVRRRLAAGRSGR